MQNEEFDAGTDPYLDEDEVWYSDDPQEAKKLSLQTKAKAFVLVAGLLVTAIFFL